MRWSASFMILIALTTACTNKSADRSEEQPDRVVRTVKAVTSQNESYLEISGTVRLKREVLLSFNTGGRIAEISVRDGDYVRSGQILARLDRTSLRAASTSAEAQAASAEAEYERLKSLRADGWVSKAQFENARAQAISYRAAAEQAKFDFRTGVIVATGPGVILRRQAELGQVVAAGVPVVSLGDLNAGFVLQLPIAESDVANLQPSQRALVTLPTISAEPFGAVVSEIGARSDDGTGTFRVELRLPPMRGLRSGLLGNARLLLNNQSLRVGSVSIPSAAVFGARADEGFVYVVDLQTKRLHRKMISIGSLDNNMLTVKSGLLPGENVVVSGVDRLRDGMTVQQVITS